MKKIINQAFHFFIITGMGWILDMAIYIVLSKIGISIVLSNIISASIAATYVYLLSTKKIFINAGKYSLKIKYIIYIIYQLCLIFISSYVIMLISNKLTSIIETNNFLFLLDYVKIIAKIINTPITMITNFIVMKLLIEKI